MKNLWIVLVFLTASPAFSQVVSTVAGTAGVIGSSNGTGTSASFNNPHGIAIDPSGNLYVAARFAHTIRKITPAGLVSTFAGNGTPGATDGNGTAASFNEPWAVACDTLGNIYVADTKNYKIRKIDPAGVVTTLAGTGTFGVTNGAVNIAQFGFPTGIAVSPDGGRIYVCDRMTNTIRKIENGNVTTVAGVVFSPGATDGPASTAQFDHPYSIAFDRNGNLIIADEYNNKIRMLSASGIVSTVAGNGSQGSADGAALSSSFNSPWGVCADSNGDILVGDANNFTIRKISQGTVSVYAGQNGIAGMVNGPALQSSFNGVSALVYNPLDNSTYLCDPYSQLVRKVAQQTLTLATQTGVSSFCIGSPVTFIASPSGLSNYVFRDGATILGTSATGTFTTTTLSQGAHNISCTATNAQGQPVASNTIQVTITAGLTVSINVHGNTSICQGDTVTLSSSLTGTCIWSTGATSASINVSSAGIYTVTVTNAQGCSGQSAPVQITTLQPPTATASSNMGTPACPGDSVLLTAGAATAYSWSNGATTQSTYVTSPGNYTVIVTNGSGCSAVSLPVSVNFYPQSVSSISPSGTVPLVQGSSVVLVANNGNGWLWSNGSTTQNLSVTTPGIYTVTVTDQNGCNSVPASVQVSYISASSIISVTGPLSFCQGDSVLLTSVFTTGNQWFRNGQVIPGATQQDYYAKLDGYYHIRYSPQQGPAVYSDSVLVTVFSLPNSIVSHPDSVCLNQSAQLSVDPLPGVLFNWYTASTGGTSLGTGLNFQTPALNQNTSYYIGVSNSNGCIGPVRFEIIARVMPSPDAQYTWSNVSSGSGGYEVSFLGNTYPGNTLYWDFGDPGSSNNYSTDYNPVHIYSQTGDYTTTLYVTSAFGCTDSMSRVLTLRPENNLFIPNSFTPNNDGNNDLFRVRGNNIAWYDLSIFNQWGQLVWHSPRETNGWDGSSEGKLVPSGTYAYAVEVVFEDGNKSFYRGNINVIR